MSSKNMKKLKLRISRGFAISVSEELFPVNYPKFKKRRGLK